MISVNKQKVFGDRAITIAFIISSLGHMAFLRIMGLNVNLRSMPRPDNSVVTIEIERPPLIPEIETMGDKTKLKEETVKNPEPESVIREEPFKITEPEEAVVAALPQARIEVIDPEAEAMLRYQDMVKQRIEKTRRYPAWAKREGIKGVVYINFTVFSDGMSRDVRIARSSGYKILDEEAVENIKRANPFPPIPQNLNRDLIEMDVSIVYTLE